MNLRPIDRSEEPEINLISLIDVLLVLVLFLVLTTTFAHEARLNVQLPQAAIEPRPLPLRPLEVVVDAQGRWYIAEREVIGTSAEALQRAMEQVAGDDRSMPLTIRADAKAPHQSVVTVMEVAGRLGFVDLAILTVKAER